MSDRRIDVSRLVGALVVVAGLSALSGLVLGGSLGRALDVAAISSLALAPAVRVVLLTVAWGRARDYRYAIASVALLILIAVSIVGTAVWR
ncbi:MAG: hypothetical protein RL072_575 [Actinomycetota bacterium]|jgi:hypothetical protein